MPLSGSSKVANVGDAVPRYLRKPGEEGYRSPTIEDIEQHQNRQAFPFRQRSNGSYMPASSTASSSLSDRAVSSAVHSAANGDATILSDDDDEFAAKLPWRERLKHLTWAYFTFTMATGGIANVLSAVPYRFSGLTIIGDIFFLGNLVAYVFIWILIILRFYFHPHTFRASFLHPTESLFVPAAAVSFGTILINISQYGLRHVGDWLNGVVEVLFWLDATLAVVLSIAIYLLLWSTQYFSVARMTPIWIFPAYPLLIIGPHAGVLSAQLRPSRALPIIIGGFTIQGVGFLVSLMVYSAFIYRLMTQKLPRESLRPGMFVSVGPSGFTVAGTVNMARNAGRAIPAIFMDDADAQLTARIIKVCADWMSLWLWGLAVWFFFISVLAHLTAFFPQSTGESDIADDNSPSGPGESTAKTRRRFQKPRMTFSMTFFSFIFPNTALITATFAIANAFDIRAMKILGCVMTCILIFAWMLVVYGMIRAIQTHVILWPEKGEDRDEGGFKMQNEIEKVSTRATTNDRDVTSTGRRDIGTNSGDDADVQSQTLNRARSWKRRASDAIEGWHATRRRQQHEGEDIV